MVIEFVKLMSASIIGAFLLLAGVLVFHSPDRFPGGVEWMRICDLKPGQGGYAVDWALETGTDEKGLPYLATDYGVWPRAAGTAATWVFNTGSGLTFDGVRVAEHPMSTCRKCMDRYWPGEDKPTELRAQYCEQYDVFRR